MKWSGRVVELNYIFLLVVTLLVALQVYLQRTQQRLELINKRSSKASEGEKGVREPGNVLRLDRPPDATETGGDTVVLADPFVPNIRKSFPKRRAPYVRKGKNKRRKNKNKLHKQQQDGFGEGNKSAPLTRAGENGKWKAARKEHGNGGERDKWRKKDSGRGEDTRVKLGGREGRIAGKGKVSFKKANKPSRVGNDYTKLNTKKIIGA